jgi:hypothetical protein
MAWVISKFMAYGVQIPDAVPRRCVQRAVMTVTAANTNTVWDIGTDAGAFWTSAKLDTTYGLATGVLAVIDNIGSNALVFDRIGGTIVSNYQPGPAVDDTVYTLSVGANGGPIITFKNTKAPTAVVLIMEWEMNEGIMPIHANLG